MDSAPAQEVTELLKQWEEQHATPNYDPIPTLTRIAEIIEAETENFMKKDPDPFDERHPSRTDPECALGHALKVMFKKDSFMTKLVNDYVRDTYYSRQNITGRDVHKLNVAACRLTLDLMPGLEMSVVFQDNDALIHRLVGWATSSAEPLQCYATGLLAAAMEVQEIATNFRDINAMLVPLMLRRLHVLRNKNQEEKQNNQNTTPPSQTRHFARFDKKRQSDVKCNGPSDKPGKKDREKDSGGGGDVEMEALSPADPSTPVKNCNSNASSPLHCGSGMMSPPPRPPPLALPPPPVHETESNSSWAEMETYVIGNIQIHPPTDATKQMLILRYLTPMGEYQEFLSHVFAQNALGLILGYLNVRESRDSRLAFEALKYLAALLCHKKFSIDFIHMGGLQKFLEVPRPSVAATGVSICLYYLAYCEDAMERVCLLPRATLADLVKYALWLLECSHDSGRCHATMFFGLSFQFRVILEEFDNQDGLRKLYNVISTLPILGSDEEESRVSEDETCAARQIVRHVCVALRRYLEAHLRLRAAHVARAAGDSVPEPPPYKDGLLLLASATTTWRPLSALWNMKEFEQMFQLDNEEYVEFSKMSDDRIIGTKGETATIFDTRTGRELLTLAPSISNQYAKNRATFNPTDELVLSDGVLWDVNSGKEIHKFDKLNQTHSGVFHPNSLEVISNTEVWDLRTFHLLRTVPTLDKSEVIFNPTVSALYAVCSDQDSEERSQFDTSFKTLDPFDYSSIATIDVKRNIYALSVNRWGTQISVVENMGDFDQMQESAVKIYDVGRKRDHDDDAEEEDEEEMAGGSENDDNSDSGSGDDDASNLLRNAVMELAGGSSGESSHDDNERPRRRRRQRRRRPTDGGSSDSDDDDVRLDDIIQFELD
ncbi:LOW QUALITY PROTEIN: protein mahjong [Cydia pomonella]|uniref:LOW QUALITY PROTEIN: protein mahjong n=1 Tax=Cydia pomonella TaxID=82600 RepID=UPI002ADDD2D0|nr:LOW QUALITY PROTEIN: protein mahjong [Cydia pomonella]